MKLRSPLLIIAGCGISLVLLGALTILFVPAGEIRGVIVRGLEQEGIVLQAEEFGKAFPLGITVRNALVSDARGLLLKLDSATVRLKIVPLLVGRVSLETTGRVGEGTVSASLQPRTSSISFHAEDVRLQDIPLLHVATGADLRGELSLDGAFAGKGTALQGDMRMEIRRAELSGIKVSGMPLPDASYETIRGMLRVSGGMGTLESLTFKGDGIYIRLKGTVSLSGPLESAPLNATIELMPKPDFLEKQKLVFLVLAKYLKSPGSYRIPVTGTLSKPVVR